MHLVNQESRMSVDSTQQTHANILNMIELGLQESSRMSMVYNDESVDDVGRDLV